MVAVGKMLLMKLEEAAVLVDKLVKCINDLTKTLHYSNIESTTQGLRDALHGTSPEECHQSWCRTRKASGWVYGSEKSLANKTHPCLVEYDKLSVLDRLKDHILIEVAKTVKLENSET